MIAAPSLKLASRAGGNESQRSTDREKSSQYHHAPDS